MHHVRIADVQADLLKEVEIAGRIASLPKILDVVCRSTGMGFAVLARVTQDRWIACGVRDALGVGVGTGDELNVQTTICHHVRQFGEPLVVNDSREDLRYRDHPALTAHGFQSFISVPVRLADGSFFGTLSAFDLVAKDLHAGDFLTSFELLADLISLNLDKELELATSRVALEQERRTSELREQFIAVLGHDLRNPLASIQTSTWVLRKQPDKAREVVDLIEQSVGRMSGLIDDVLDFARGRLGSGIAIECRNDVDLDKAVGQVVGELRSSHPNREIETDIRLGRAVRCDPVRIGQLVSNLVGNALTHGDSSSPVVVRGAVQDGLLQLAVANSGSPIPAHALEMLFQPFVRASADSCQQGLGLGLFIASEVAHEHGGHIDVHSDLIETRFTFSMPLAPPHLLREIDGIARQSGRSSAVPATV